MVDSAHPIPPSSPSEAAGLRLRQLGVLAAVQFLVLLDHSMIFSLGPDLAIGVGIPMARLGAVVAAYTAAAAIAGLLVGRSLDRVDRRLGLGGSLLLIAGGGLIAATATAPTQLLLARAINGLGGGPAIALCHAIIADGVSPERRGRAMSVILGAHAVTMILGIPAALILAQLCGWAAPFVGITVAAALLAITQGRVLPVFRAATARPPWRRLLRQPGMLSSGMMVACGVGAIFLINPNMSAFVQYNLGLPREDLAGLYGLGGIGGGLAVLLGGWLVDRLRPSSVAAAGTLTFVGVVGLFFAAPTALPLSLAFPLMYAALSLRVVAARTLATFVPAPSLRAGSLALLVSIQHVASAIAAAVSTGLLSETAEGALIGMPAVAGLSIALSLFTLFWVLRTERASLGAAPS